MKKWQLSHLGDVWKLFSEKPWVLIKKFGLGKCLVIQGQLIVVLEAERKKEDAMTASLGWWFILFG